MNASTKRTKLRKAEESLLNVASTVGLLFGPSSKLKGNNGLLAELVRAGERYQRARRK